MVSQWETAALAPSLERIADWSRIFGVPAAYFLGEIDLDEEDLRGDANGDSGTGSRRPLPVARAVRGIEESTGSKGPLPVGRATNSARAVRGYDPDEAETPPGLEELIESGMVMTGREFSRLRGYADPLEKEVGANGAWQWSAEEWLEVLMKERLEAWREKVRRAK